jgi:glycosyltransferase involved in cell wall biosynthesis
MTAPPLISIVMPCYQQVSFLEEAVRSVLDQRGVAVELIVMDPGSTDGSRDLLENLKTGYGERLVLHFAPDSGQSDAVNRGMAMARGTVLGWLNSDDRLRPGALLRVMSYLDSAEPRWVYGRCGIMNEQGEQISKPIVWYKNIRGRHFSLHKFLTEDFIPQMATFWNRSLWEMTGGVDEKRNLAFDYDLFLRFARHAAPAVVTEYLADFRVHRDAKSSLRTDEHMEEAYATVCQHAADLGWRGKLSLILHRIYGARTRLIYRLIKP